MPCSGTLREVGIDPQKGPGTTKTQTTARDEAASSSGFGSILEFVGEVPSGACVGFRQASRTVLSGGPDRFVPGMAGRWPDHTASSYHGAPGHRR